MAFKLINNTEPDYLHIEWNGKIHFFGFDKNLFYLFEGPKKSISEVSYTQEIKASTSSCCSSTTSFYALHYNPKLPNSLSVRLMDVINNYKHTNKTVLKSYQLKTIDSRMLSGIRVGSSKQFLKSVADRTLALCIHDKSMIKILILDYIDKNNPIVTPMRDISIRTIGRRAEFSKVAIVSMMTKIRSLRTLAVVIGTKSHLIAEYLQYYPSIQHKKIDTSLTKIPYSQTIISLNSSLNYIKCSDPETTAGEYGLLINSRCVVVMDGYLIKSLNFTSQVLSYSVLDAETVYSLSKIQFKEINEYEIPRFYETISARESPDYLAIHAMNTVDNHQEILIFKTGRRQVWTSVYSSANMETAYDIGKWNDGTSWMFLNEIGSELKVYLIGNMTLEVIGGYDSKGELRLLYSTFGRPSEVERYNREFKFFHKQVKDSNTLLVVYGSVGGIFGVLVILWCCCCVGRCSYFCIKRKFYKRERKVFPILRKKKKRKKE